MKTAYKSIITIVLVGLLASLLSVSVAKGEEPPAIEWENTFGGSSDDEGRSVQQTTDGGYIIVGMTGSYIAGTSDIYLIKTDASGDKQWENTFGGSHNDRAHSVQQTTDGGYIIVGATFSYGVNAPYYPAIYLIKTDASGNEEWARIFSGGKGEHGYSVQQTTDGGYIIVGATFSYGVNAPYYPAIYLIKTDASGNEEWARIFSGGKGGHGYSVQQTTDGGYIIAGLTYPSGAGISDVYLLKTDAFGNKQWEKTFGGSYYDAGYSVRQTTDGGYIIAGLTYSSGADNSDVYLLKTDAFGNKQWENTFGGSYYGYYDAGYSVRQTTDGGYIIAGITGSIGSYLGHLNDYLVKTDAFGNKQWETTFGPNRLAYDVQQTTDGGYIVVGENRAYRNGGGGFGGTDVYLIKLLGRENQPPIADAGGPYEGYVGSPITVDASGSYDPDSDPLQYRWDFTNDGTWDTEWLTELTATYTWGSDYQGTVKLEVTDGEFADTATTTVTVLSIVVKPIPANVTIEPETLNLKSEGEFTAFIQLPEGYDVANIDVSTVVCEGAPAIKGMVSDEDGSTYIVKFNRQDLVNVPTGNTVTLRVTGKVSYNGGVTDFEGSDTVRVINQWGGS